MSTLKERFVAFFAAANGTAPYPWQRSLVQRIGEDGVWPDIAAPTGAGKSSVVDIHMFLVGEHAAGRLSARAPRRLVLIAPRRVLVDDQYERALALARSLRQANDGPLRELADVLRSLYTSRPDNGDPLGVWRMRGGVRTETGWRLEPAACQIVCATPQMWGSRLLLRGYGASRNSRNLETGLLCHDAVAIIDEAHLHERLVDTARSVAERNPGPDALQVVAMSATRRPDRPRVTLADADRAEASLAGRVQAVKRIRRIEVADWKRDVVGAVVQAAEQLSGDGTVGVFVNDVPSAFAVASRLGGEQAGVVLVCGRLRPADVSLLREKHRGLLSAQGNPNVGFLVSTQSLEVGVDLDLPAMVTMVAPASALAQRAGRLNRSGSRAASTFTVIVPADVNEPFRSGPYEHEELMAGAAWLEQLGDSISPERVSDSPLPSVARPVLPSLRFVDLETLAMTSEPQSADPEPDLYLIDPQRETSTIGIVARLHLGAELNLEDEVIEAALRACPPRQHEVATITLGRAANDILELVRERAWIVAGASGPVQVERVREDTTLSPDDTLVVPSGARVCVAGVVGLPDSKERLGPLDAVLHWSEDGEPRDHVVPVRAEAMAEIIATDPGIATRQGRRDLAGVLKASHPALALRLRQHQRLSDLAVTWCGGEVETGLLVVSELRGRAVQFARSVPMHEVSLEGHQQRVEARLREAMDALKLPPELLPLDGMLHAARHHDDGKQHPYFQRWMGAAETVVAKARPGYVPDRGNGWRHEQLSAAFLSNPFEIVVTAGHHGRGRCLFNRGADELLLLEQWPQCPPAVRERARELFGDHGSYETLRTQVQRELGVHRLAWFEALLRCADMQVSREEETE